MSKVVKPNRRFSNYSRGHNPAAWITVATYNGRDIQPQYDVPDWLRLRWLSSKSELGYTGFTGFSLTEALTVIALAKGNKVILDINRWGHVASYKLRNEKPAHSNKLR